jgi:WhiB family redox-sensing transcriptional regulator
LNELDWQEKEAPCLGLTIIFFGEESETTAQKDARIKRAKDLCQECPMSDPCLEYALVTQQPYGIWGGKTSTERRSLIRRRARQRRIQ